MYFQIEYIDLDQFFFISLDFVRDSIGSNTKPIAQELFFCTIRSYYLAMIFNI